jgi:carbon storage regulator
MLVLSRKLNESIVIGGDIEITVVSLRGNHVRLGITAPDSVGILREELCRRVPITEHDRPHRDQARSRTALTTMSRGS